MKTKLAYFKCIFQSLILVLQYCILILLLFPLIACTYSILLDELIMSFSQRRIGPYNIGGYGIFPSLINGCNLISILALPGFIISKLLLFD